MHRGEFESERWRGRGWVSLQTGATYWNPYFYFSPAQPCPAQPSPCTADPELSLSIRAEVGAELYSYPEGDGSPSPAPRLFFFPRSPQPGLAHVWRVGAGGPRREA